MWNLLAAIACSLAIGVSFKIAATRGLDRLVVVTANYFVAAGAAILIARAQDVQFVDDATPAFAGLAVATGVLFIGSFMLFALATHLSGMSLSVGVNRVSVVLPFAASWLIWNETTTVVQLGGLGLACIAFFLIARRNRDNRIGAEGLIGRATVVLVLLFVAGGFADVSMKTFDAVFSAAHARSHFMLMIFSTAFAIGCFFVAVRMRRHRLLKVVPAAGLGAVLGVVNLGSVEFLLRALEKLPGTLVFPVINIAIVLGGALLGAAIWREPISRTNWLGFVVACVALLLLGIG